MNRRPELILNLLFAIFGLLLGPWIIHMGLEGRTPAQVLSSGEIPAFISMGCGSVWTGIFCIFGAIGWDKFPKWLHKTLLAGYIVCIGAPFILLGVLFPAGISSPVPGRYTGAFVFIGVGIVLIALTPFFLRQLTDVRNNSDSGKPNERRSFFRKVKLVATMQNLTDTSSGQWAILGDLLREKGLTGQNGRDVVTVSSSDFTSIHAPDSEAENVRQILREAIARGIIDSAKLGLTVCDG